MNAPTRRRFTLPDEPKFESVETVDVIFHGEPLTDERVDEIVEDVRRANLVPGGKSLNGDGSHSRALSVRLPDDVRAKLEEIAAARGIRPSKLVREVLAEFVANDPTVDE
ncbi:ribbon-helix-helix protein, CopG family [Agromyces mangrovi Wang et al. 2018]|uniref:ribbon-helix-helix protein, CopG family n=1 Tax=Agromyces mangrovi TaxID=1858653 RepID=UPI0025726157|nr:ribbon-helix-helix protein, CopG family [Agromyces mangrovi]BDZ65448.1 hypothetical protein GCM10025877_23860 [Agromyces mangrovi]